MDNQNYLVACDGYTVIVAAPNGKVKYFTTVNGSTTYTRPDVSEVEKAALLAIAKKSIEDWHEHQQECKTQNGHAIVAEVIVSAMARMPFISPMPPQGKFSVN